MARKSLATLYSLLNTTSKMAKNKKEGTPKVHPELEGFNITIDKFGQLKSNMTTEQLNEFLNKNVDDKKLRDRDGDDKEKDKK